MNTPCIDWGETVVPRYLLTSEADFALYLALIRDKNYAQFNYFIDIMFYSTVCDLTGQDLLKHVWICKLNIPNA